VELAPATVKAPRVTVNRASFMEIIGRIQTIPSLPEVVAQIFRLVNNPSSDAKQIHDIVVKDPAMVAKMLRMVNSVYYGLPDPVRDLEQALVILGFKTIRSIALSISVINMFQQQNTCFSMRAFWTHGAVLASICRLAARKIGGICDPEQGFIIGLLKDIGKLVLVENAPTETRSIVAVAREFKLPFHKAAWEVIGTDDAEIGAWLCQHWGLEEALIETVRHQNDLEAAKFPKHVAMIQFCEYICAIKNLRVSGNHDEPHLANEILSTLGIEKDALVEVMEAVNSEADNARALLALAR
jgi:HD-like signal output (HDOD) protein